MNAWHRARQAPVRLARLTATVRRERGEWTTRRVQRLYVTLYGPGDWRSTARTDLRTPVTEGVLRRLHDVRDNTYQVIL